MVAVVGALSPEKRVQLACHAVAALETARLVVVGEGDERDELEALCEKLLPGRFQFTGALPDVRPVLHAADVVLMTSASEGVPGVLVEAGLCGLPCVTSAVGYVHDVVADGKTGLLVSSGRSEDFTSALRRALAESSSFGRAARERCVARFDSDRVVDVWAELLNKIGTG